MDAPRIAACLIVKNSAGTIEQCLASIRPYVDGIFVYDTGSTDDTLAVLERLNQTTELAVDAQTGRVVEVSEPPADEDPAAVTRIPLAPIMVEQGGWRDDFSWARTQSFAMVPADEYTHYLWLDDDDVIVGAEQLRRLASDPGPNGFVLFYDYARDEAGNCVCQLWRERLIRADVGFRWVGAVHEVLLPPEGIDPRFAQVPPQMIRYIHNRPADRYAPDRNLAILLTEKERAEEAGEQVQPRTLAYIGTELMARGRFDEAAPFLDGYLDRADTGWSDERMQIAHKLAICMRVLGNPLASVEVEMRALRERDDWAETYVGLLESFAMLNQWDRVDRWAKRALELGPPQTALIVNPLEFTTLPMLRLAEAAVHMGKLAECDEWLQQAVAAAPGQAAIQQRASEVAQMRVRADAVQQVLALRELLVRFDENEKAYRLMELAVPYLAADDPQVVRARADQREMVRHFTHPEEYRRWYEDEPKESSLTDEHIDLVGDWFGRVKGLHDGLRAQEEELGRKPTLLDLGCNDWWMGEYFARHEIVCDGIELNKRSYDLALERIERFGRDVTVVQGDLHDAEHLLASAKARTFDPGVDGYPLPAAGELLPEEKYDAVSMFEVYEHVPDTARALEVMESLIKPGGRIYISTPNGAFEHGQIQDWANVVRKGHLRAIPMHELAETIMQRGEIEQLEETNGDRVAFVSYTPAPRKGTVTFYAGQQWEPWSATSLKQGGIGGSETALVQVATRMAAAGWAVKVYSSAEPGLLGGVLYRPFTSWDPTEEVDLLVVSRIPYIFDNPIGAKQSALWCHDHSYDILTPERAEKIDHIVTLSEWQRDRFARLYPWAEPKLRIIRNGISLLDWLGDDNYPHATRGFKKRKPRVVYSSSADRGLDVLLDLWPRIRAKVANAELHIFYGFDTLDRVAQMNPNLAAFKQALLAKVTELGGPDAGVILRGRVGQDELAAEMQEARVLGYPTAFLETSCITAMEARAAGLAIVTSDLGALHETVAHHGNLIAWETVDDDGRAISTDESVSAMAAWAVETEQVNRTTRYQDEFVDAVVGALTRREVWQVWHQAALDGRAELDWQNRVPEWEALAETRAAVEAAA